MRYNLDDEFFADPRYEMLAELIGDGEKTVGRCVKAWRLAWKYHENGKLIPRALAEHAGIMDLVRVDLAEEREDGIYVRGTDEKFAWIFKNRESAQAGGRKSAEARKEKYGSAKPQAKQKRTDSEPTCEANPNRTLSKPEPNANQPLNQKRTDTNALAPALAPALAQRVDEGISSESHSPAEKNPGSKKRKSKNPPGPKTPSGGVWQAYREGYHNRYGVDPVRNAKVNAQCSQLVSRLGQAEAPRVAAFYVTLEDKFYRARGHDLGICLKDAENLRTRMLSGKAAPFDEQKPDDPYAHFKRLDVGAR